MSQSFKHTIVRYYCIIFYALFLYKLYNGMLLCQLQPAFFYTTPDVVSWLFLQAGMPQWLLHTKHFLLFDVLFYTAPVTLLTIYIQPRLLKYAAVYILIINWLYLQCYLLYPISSATVYVAWLLFPVIFTAEKEQTFMLLLGGIRYLFLYFFLSAGVWKLVNGGVFNLQQLSAVLLEQHKELLTNSPNYRVSQILQWVISHTVVSYILYLLVTLMELSFAIGFFTKKYDSYLAVIYLVFLIADHFMMRILYYETLPLLLSLYFRPVNILEQK